MTNHDTNHPVFAALSPQARATIVRNAELAVETARRERNRLSQVLTHDCDPRSEVCHCFGAADVRAYEAARAAHHDAMRALHALTGGAQ